MYYNLAEDGHTPPSNTKVKRTGEFRCPKAGEWFISGAIPEGYNAPNDLSTKYHIGKLVKIKTVTIEVEE